MENLQGLIRDLEQERHLEHALTAFKEARLDLGLWGAVHAELRAAVAKSRLRRMSLWQVDPHRRTLRLRFEVRRPLCGENTRTLVTLLARMLMDAGLPVAMGLEKNPRPAVHLGHPLPLDVEGEAEWADAVLQEAPSVSLDALPAAINRHAPGGLRVLQCAIVPNYASPVSDLCKRGFWRWACPEPLLAEAQERMEAFVTADRFEIEKPGKVDGNKAPKHMDIRPLLGVIEWQGPQLSFQTRIGPGEAANPRKLLAAILGLLPEAIQPLCRTEVELMEDPRLLQAEKFTPKLHNMFEDAVLLHSGSNIRIIDDDDDAPLVISKGTVN